ncbi:MAG: imidazole glycerol phosphate synthase subunit HisH [Roseimicrobium sp.]
MNLGVLDYGAGNLRSVLNAFAAIDAPATLVTAPEHFEQLDVLIFPGQGAFGDSVRQLQARGLWAPLQAWLRDGRPYLGICLGYQLLFDSSEENPEVQGLGKFHGQVRKFAALQGLKIPHMGWNSVRFAAPAHPLWQGLGDACAFYFVHSYFPDPADSTLAACLTDYAGEFASGIVSEKLVAVQFHPEKSQQAGLTLLRNAVQFLGN